MARLRAEGVTHPHALDVLMRHAVARALPTDLVHGRFPVGVRPIVEGDYTKVEFGLADVAPPPIVWPERVAELFER